jgi:hypothetical protein
MSYIKTYSAFLQCSYFKIAESSCGECYGLPTITINNKTNLHVRLCAADSAVGWGECNEPQHVHHLCCGVCVGGHCQRVRISAASSARMRMQFQLLVRVMALLLPPTLLIDEKLHWSG